MTASTPRVFFVGSAMAAALGLRMFGHSAVLLLGFQVVAVGVVGLLPRRRRDADDAMTAMTSATAGSLFGGAALLALWSSAPDPGMTLMTVTMGGMIGGTLGADGDGWLH